MSKHNTYIKIVKTTTVLGLMGLYMFAFLFPSLHQLVEHSHDDTIHCSNEIEQDPCHQKVYHHNVKNGCHHDTHVHNPKHTCKFCDVLPTENYTFQQISFEIVVPQMVSTYEIMATQIFISPSFPSISLRGPPTAC